MARHFGRGPSCTSCLKADSRFRLHHEGVFGDFMSRPLQVYLEEEDHLRLEAWAREKGWTKSQAVRFALRAATHQPIGDPLLDAAGMVEGLPPDASERIHHYLEESYVAESPSKYTKSDDRKRTRVRR